MYCRGVRGATTVDDNTSEAILAATHEILDMIVKANGIEKDDVATIIFTLTEDVNAEFPAIAARQAGWLETPLLCAREIHVPGSTGMVLRVLMLWNTDKHATEIEHIYIRGAAALRPGFAREVQDR